MSNEYTAVTFITIRCLSKLERDAADERVVRVMLSENPQYNSNTTIFMSKGQLDIPQEATEILGKLLSKAIVAKLLTALPDPEGAEITREPAPAEKDPNTSVN